MTEEQKEILIAKMIDAPSTLTDEELAIITEDQELRDIYETSSAISGASLSQSAYDPEEEWERFRPRIRRKSLRMHWFMRTAAIFLGVIFASGLIVRFIDKTLTEETKPAIAKVEQKPTSPVSSPISKTSASTISKSNEQRTKILKQKPVYDKKKPAYDVADSEESEFDIDIEEYLRVQQARIDNDLALQAAEIYREEYLELMPFLGLLDEVNEEMDNSIDRITDQ